MMRVRLLLSFALALAFEAHPQTNVIVIISDDAGFADFGFQGASEVPTPNLDGLAQSGVRFSSAYTAAVCSPSRAAITTGAYQQRIGYEYNINNLTDPNGPREGLPSETITIFERMQSLGYTTGAVGKWHLGALPDITSGGVVAVPGNRPPRQGVDEFFGILKGSRSYSVGGTTGVGTLREMSLGTNGLEIDTIVESSYSGQYVTEVFGSAATNFIALHHQDVDPFFLYVSFTAPHGPLNISPDYNDSSITNLTDPRRKYASMMLTMDKEIGKILNSLRDPNGDGGTGDSIENRTLVIFINDNGGASSNASDNTPLRNWKGSTYEGGIRVPMLIAGAGIIPTNTTYDLPVHSIDILPTVFTVGGGTFGSADMIDGVNLLPYVNGANTNAPHEVLVVRNEDRIGLRKGDLKLVKPDRGQPYAFYDLATDIGEATNVAGANLTLVEELKRDVTAFEVLARKPAHAGLGKNANSINLNDHFTLAPSAPSAGSFSPDIVLIDFDDGLGNGIHESSVRNGGFEENPVGSGVEHDKGTYAETDHWVNIATTNQTDVLVRTNLNDTTPQNAVLTDGPSREAAADTGHILAMGEEFAASYRWRDASLWVDPGDRVAFTFYTTTDDSIEGPILNAYPFLSALSAANAAYQQESVTWTAAAVDSGKRLFISLNGIDGGGGPDGFCRVDDVYLARGTSGTSPEPSVVNWSDAGGWIDHDTGLSDTLLDLDAYANAIFEFPTTDNFSYEAVNNMTRPTELELMLNRINLSGFFTGSSNQSATLSGNPLLFVDSLDEAAPHISIEAANPGGNGSPGFSYEIANDLVLYNDLVVDGDGDVPVEFSGIVQDYFASRGLAKSGSSTVTLSGSSRYTGDTTISNGILRLAATGSISNTGAIVVHDGATFDVSEVVDFSLGTNQSLKGNGTVVGMTTAGGSVEPGHSIGMLTFSNDLVLTGAAIMEINREMATNDVIRCAAALSLGGSLVVQNLGASLEAGDQFQLFSATTYSGAFSTILPAIPGGGLEWDTSNVAVNGTLGVVAALPAVGTNLTHSVSDGEITLGWPGDYLGWILQRQTNALDTGLQANPGAWIDVLGSEVVTSTNLPIDVSSGTTFFRLRHP